MSDMSEISECLGILPHQFWLAHPVSPYALDLDWSEDLFTQPIRYPICCVRWVLSSTSQARRPPWTLTVKIVIVVSVLSVIDRDRPSLGGSG